MSVGTPPPSEWLWQALRDGQHKLVKNLAPANFNWNSLHPVFGTPLMATVHELVLLTSGKKQELHEMVRWCMRLGADPRVVAPDAEALSVGIPPAPPGPGWTKYAHKPREFWWHYDGMLGQFFCNDLDHQDIHRLNLDEYTIGDESQVRISAERHAGHSAISLVIAIKRKLMCGGNRYKYLIKNADQLLGAFADVVLIQAGPSVSVDEGVADTWARAMRDMDRADVELRVMGSGGVAAACSGDPGGAIHAHSLLLCNASPVLKASLESPMQEGRSKVVTVSDVTGAALQHVLTLVYTGCADDDEDIPLRMQMEALDLAHRWQIDHVVDSLDRSLSRQVSEGLEKEPADQHVRLLDQLLESAVLKHLWRLHMACHELVSREPLFRKAHRDGAFGVVAARDLQRSFASGPERERKEKRRRHG